MTPRAALGVFGLLLLAGEASLAWAERGLQGAGPAPAPAPARAACIANPSAPIDDPPAFPTRYLGGCKTCSPDGSRCIECWMFFGLASNGTCVECPYSGPESYICLNCLGDEPSHCLKCSENLEEPIVPGLYAAEDGRCTKCGDGCAACQNLNGTCTECDVGMGLVEGKCVKCDPALGENVEHCNGNPKQTTSCQWGYYVDKRTGACQQCTVENCSECDASGQCATCAGGYGLDGAGKCVECKLEGCTQCATLDVCKECNSGGFLLLPNATSCTPCTDRNCSSCDKGADRCEYCREDSGTGPDKDTGRCVPCKDEQCTLCPADAGFCWTCREGWRQNPSTRGCTACALSNCATCDTDADTGGELCTACKPGWELQSPEDGKALPACVQQSAAAPAPAA